MVAKRLEREVMIENVLSELAVGEFKEIEQQIVEFYKEIAKKSKVDLKTTEIFAYLKIYNSLTQKQLKFLTDFSSGFISIILKSFVQSSIVVRNFIPKSHTNIYSINNEYVFTIITPRAQVNTNQEQHDNFIKDLQSKLEFLKEKYPLKTTFLHRRLNGIRNFIETQRRIYTEFEKKAFLNEDVSGLLQLDEFIDYPFEIKKLETSLVDRFVRMEMFVENDPIINKILTYLITRESLNQEKLLELTNLSRSTISRNLRSYWELDYAAITKKEYLKPRIYCINSIGIYLCEIIINNNRFLISWLPKFEELLSELKINPKYTKDKNMNIFFQTKIGQIISKITNAQKHTKRLEKAQKELIEFNAKNQNGYNFGKNQS
ncbi:MAG TPA: hypothetical protein VMZ29_10870 [Candidatus Bathyarchaeia archaeon]|nr:hypothetical protein [Candidatus Bathyarchaeia archaeon]